MEAIVVKTRKLEFAENLVRMRGCIRIWCYNLEHYEVGDFYKKLGWLEEDFIQEFQDGQNCFRYSKQLDRTGN